MLVEILHRQLNHVTNVAADTTTQTHTHTHTHTHMHKHTHTHTHDTARHAHGTHKTTSHKQHNTTPHMTNAIPLQLLKDPVVTTCRCGSTFERSAVQQWWAMGNASCPMCLSPLSSQSLVPNVALRRVVQAHGLHRGAIKSEAH